MRKLRNREMVNPAQRHIAEKWQSQNSSGLSSTRVWILSWLKVTECVDERLGFQLSVQSSDCNLVHWHSVQTLLLGHRSCISVYVFQLMELYSWFQKWVSVTQFWPALLVRTTDKGMGMCLQVAKKKKKIHFENFSFWEERVFISTLQLFARKHWQSYQRRGSLRRYAWSGGMKSLNWVVPGSTGACSWTFPSFESINSPFSQSSKI